MKLRLQPDDGVMHVEMNGAEPVEVDPGDGNVRHIPGVITPRSLVLWWLEGGQRRTISIPNAEGSEFT